MILLLWLAVPALAALGVYEFVKAANPSQREDIPDTGEVDMSADEGGKWADLEELMNGAHGWPYAWGGGAPSTPWADGPKGVDCSGFVQMALVRLGYLDSGATDRGARALADGCVPVSLGEQEPGDLAYYPGHVMLVCGPPGQDGHAPVIGASGGTSDTHGDDPKAYVKVFDTGAYRRDFVTYMRLKA
jgi:cell wall-associated NlpC family hydrolase